MKFNRTGQSGFTLIELVVVIVILGILAATAIPKFVDLSSEAETAAVQGVAGGLSSAAAINYAGCSVVNNVVTANKCVQVAKCSDVGTLLNPALTLVVTPATPVASTYYIAADTAATTNGTSVTCTLNRGGNSPTSFTAIGAAN